MICFGFGTNEKWTSKLIRWATRSEWSHAWVVYPSAIWGGRWVAHAWPKGVVKVPLEKVEEMYPKRRIYGCELDLGSGLLWARKYIYVDYDYGVIWNGLMLVLFRVTGWRWLWKVVTRNAAKMSCSEFVCGILKAAEVGGTEDIDPELTTPGALEKFCSDSNDFWVI